MGVALRYISETIHNHPLANKRGVVLVHRRVLYEKIGPGAHKCHWCQKDIEWTPGRRNSKTLVVDHVDENVTNNCISNLVASCVFCNGQRSLPSLIRNGEVFIVHKSGNRQRAQWIPCKHCSKSFLSPKNRRGEALIAYCSTQCVGESRRGGDKWKKVHTESPFKVQQGEVYIRNGRWKQRATLRKCSQCGAEFPHRKDYRIEGQRNFFCQKSCEVIYRRLRKKVA